MAGTLNGWCRSAKWQSRLHLQYASLITTVFVALGTPALAGGYHAIYTFLPSNGADGHTPSGNLTMDAQGRLYGTTSSGGLYGRGTIYRLTPPASGQGPWTEDILHAFAGALDGANPYGPITLGPDGTLYGSAPYGGAHGRGTVFSLQNAPNGSLRVLHNFTYADGGGPSAGVVFGVDGLLYGTTSSVSLNTYRDTGTDFSVSPLGDAVEYRVLHAFGKPGDGFAPTGLETGPLSVGDDFIGATEMGPDALVFGGDVYSLRIYPDGQVREQQLYTFGVAPDVASPQDPPILGTGNLRQTAYGCGDFGGTHGVGGIYRLVTDGQGGVVESVIYNFGDQPNDPEVGPYRACHLVSGGRDGKLYGITDSGGTSVSGEFSGGTFFEMDPPATAGAQWSLKVDVNFLLGSPGGYIPITTPLHKGGVFYGTTEDDTVYQLTP